jgi:hypothetical protein
VERFAAAAERAGFVLVGSNNSRNGPYAPAEQAIELMYADTHARFRLDPSREYAAGLSGGARLALRWAMLGRLAGVVASSAGFPTPTVPKQVPQRIFFTTGYDDFNHDELYHVSRELAARKIEHRYAEFEGGHEWLPASLTDEALGYLSGTVPPRAAEPSKQAERDAADFARRYEEIQKADEGARAMMVRGLLKERAKPEDSPSRRVARRLLGSLSTGSMEQAREAMAQKQYAHAAKYAQIAVLVRPENGNAWFTLATARAAMGDRKRSLEAIEQGLKYGLHKERVEAEPLLEKVRKERHYAEIVKE